MSRRCAKINSNQIESSANRYVKAKSKNTDRKSVKLSREDSSNEAESESKPIPMESNNIAMYD